MEGAKTQVIVVGRQWQRILPVNPKRISYQVTNEWGDLVQLRFKTLKPFPLPKDTAVSERIEVSGTLSGSLWARTTKPEAVARLIVKEWSCPK